MDRRRQLAPERVRRYRKKQKEEVQGLRDRLASYEEFCDYVVANHHEIILEYEMTKLSTQPQMSPAEIDALSAEAVEDFLSKF